jgi:hypothetical protein
MTLNKDCRWSSTVDHCDHKNLLEIQLFCLWRGWLLTQKKCRYTRMLKFSSLLSSLSCLSTIKIYSHGRGMSFLEGHRKCKLFFIKIQKTIYGPSHVKNLLDQGHYVFRISEIILYKVVNDVTMVQMTAKHSGTTVQMLFKIYWLTLQCKSFVIQPTLWLYK